MRPVVWLLLIVAAGRFSARADEVIKDVSPNGKYALLVMGDKDAEDADLNLIETATKKVLLNLDTLGHPYSESSDVLWSRDSRRFAYHSDDRRGGDTTVYALADGKFVEVALPKIRDLDLSPLHHNEVVNKTDACGITAVRWLKSGSLVLQEDVEEDGGTVDASGESAGDEMITRTLAVTVGFDSKGRTSIEHVTRKIAREWDK